MNDPCKNCQRENCRDCEYILGLSREYEVNRRTAKDIRDLISYSDYDEEDAVNLIAKGKIMKGIFIR